MNADIYERHQLAVMEWRRACEAVENAEDNRAAARARLDEIGQELLASCADSKRIKPVVKRAKRAKIAVEKVNGATRWDKATETWIPV